MSMQNTIKVVKFEGGFDDMTALNNDLRALTASDFIDCLIETATDSGITNVNLFGITTGYLNPGQLGLISQDEGSLDNDYCQLTRTYCDFDNDMLKVISDHLKEGSKLVISITDEEGWDQTIYIITDTAFEVKELHELV